MLDGAHHYLISDLLLVKQRELRVGGDLLLYMPQQLLGGGDLRCEEVISELRTRCSRESGSEEGSQSCQLIGGEGREHVEIGQVGVA
jgi:hypothetical protein